MAMCCPQCMTQNPKICHLNPSYPLGDFQDQEISVAATGDPGTSDKPPRKVYMPEAIRGMLITWAHTSTAMGHPGVVKMAQLLTNHKPMWRTL